ncbi:hypothetical protein AB6A40_007569 [Gnathostoma spinigerum]|uniref:PX domain-containing protein n=1 Tax=Gnathostoma spinigerum TaxID=75299 RepID=A0ABD6EMU4_9BILA
MAISHLGVIRCQRYLCFSKHTKYTPYKPESNFKRYCVQNFHYLRLMSSIKVTRCEATPSVDKHCTIYTVLFDSGKEIRKAFVDYEKLCAQLKESTDFPSDLIPQAPKKKFLQADAKLIEKRRIWVEQLARELLGRHVSCDLVRVFFNLGDDTEEDTVDLGSSERKNVKPNDFDFLKTVGKGSFGKVCPSWCFLISMNYVSSAST